MKTEKLNIVVRRGLWCLVAAYVLLHLCVTVGWMVSPWVNEYREWAQADAVLQLFHLHGGELYGGPGSTSLYVYGFLFPGLGYLLTLMTGLEPLLVLRLAAYVCTIGAAALAASVVWKRSGSRLYSALAFAIMLSADWNNVTGTATASPLGMLVMLGSLMAAERKLVGWSALLTVVCFFVKPYFVGVWLPLQIFFFQLSRRQGWTYLGLCLSLGLASALWVHHLFPNYFVYNVVHHMAAASADWRHLAVQLLWSIFLYLPLFVVFVNACKEQRLKVFGDVYGLAALCLFLLWLRLGLHTGAFMSYVLHQWLPPLVVFALPKLKDVHGRRRRLLLAGWIVCVSLFVGGFLLTLPMFPSQTERAQWERVASRMDLLPTDSTLCISPLFAQHAEALCLPSRDNGMTQFYSTLSSPSPFMRALIPETKAFDADATTHEMQLLRRHDGGLYAYVVADDRCVVPSDSLRALGYDEKDADTVRVGVHRVGVRLFVLPDSLISR